MEGKKNMERWEKTRSKGFVMFMLEVAFLRYALPVTLFSQVVTYLFRYGVTADGIGEALSQRNIYYWLVAVLSSGLLFGSMFWLVAERAYRKYSLRVE